VDALHWPVALATRDFTAQAEARARLVRRTLAMQALHSPVALATSATPDQTAACAPLAQPENTKLRRARSRAQIAEPARTRQP
jgi:hypothetical protein